MTSQITTSGWSVKNGRPHSIPECQNMSQLSCLGRRHDCGGFYFRCTTCTPLLVLDHYNPGYKTKIEYIPRIDCIKPKKRGLFNDDSGYHGEVMDFYGAYLSQIMGLKGVAVHSWSSKHAKLFFAGVGKDNFEIDWLAFLENTLNVCEIGRRNFANRESSDQSKKSVNSSNSTTSKENHTVSKGTKKLIKEKINQLIRDKSIVESLLRGTKCENIPVNYFLVLPNVPIEEILEVLEEKKERLDLDNIFTANSRLAIISSDAIPLQQVHVYHGDAKVSKVPQKFKEFVKSDGEKWHPTFEYLTSAVVISILLTKLTMKTSPSRELSLNEHCSEREHKVIQQQMGWTKNPTHPTHPTHRFPKTLVLGPEQLQAMNSNKRVVLLMGEAGSGKTTVLLAVIFKFTRKHLRFNNLRKIIFFIPTHKITFRKYIESFVRENCETEWVQIVTEKDENSIGPKCTDAIFLFDEIYDTDFITRNLNRGKIYAVVIPGEKMSFKSNIFLIPRPDVQIFYFRKIYRTPANLSRCCAKLKRFEEAR